MKFTEMLFWDWIPVIITFEQSRSKVTMGQVRREGWRKAEEGAFCRKWSVF